MTKITTVEDALDLVYEMPERFHEVPVEYRSIDVCLLAIISFGSICEHVPEEHHSESFFLEAVRTNCDGKALKYIPMEYRTLKICEKAVSRFPEAIEYVPESLRSKVSSALSGSQHRS